MLTTWFFQDRRDYSRKFEFLASTIAFLADHKFDFNTAFSKGVQYLTKDEERILKEKHEASKNRIIEQNKSKKDEVVSVPDINKIEDGNIKGSSQI